LYSFVFFFSPCCMWYIVQVLLISQLRVLITCYLSLYLISLLWLAWVLARL
jgi:hypothetical protein